MKKFWVILLLVILASCAAKKKAAEFEAQPDWVKQKPIVPGYYIGVGSAIKVGTSSQYIAKAREDALADMASEISTQVSSNSVFRTIETTYGHTETFNQKIEVSASDYLEGFEPVASYETADRYWVYFKIGRDTYKVMKNKKKQETVNAAMAKYAAGVNEQRSNRPVEAITFFLQGLQVIKPYMNEETPAGFNGQTIDAGNAIFTALNEVTGDLTIVAESSTIQIKRSVDEKVPLLFDVMYKGFPGRNIPVRFSFSGGYLKTDKGRSDNTGRVKLELGPVYSKNNNEQLKAEIDLEDIARKALDDLFVRSLLTKNPPRPANVQIKIIPPSVMLDIDEQACTEDRCDRIRRVFAENVVREGFIVSQTDPDYHFRVDYSFTPGTTAGALTSIFLKTVIHISDKNGKEIWTKEFPEIRGTASSQKAANEKAFDEFIVSFGKLWIRQGLDELK